MKAETLKALKASIAKWRKLENGSNLNVGPDYCPLCSLYYHKKDCNGCPVAVATKRSRCIGTPYSGYLAVADAYGPYSERTLEVAQDMRVFLQSLLPTSKRRG